MGIKFTWSRAKANRNLIKHGVSFEAARRVFADPYLIVVEDREDERGEMRYHAVGYGDKPQILLTITFVDRSTHEQGIIHFISARKADDYEQSAYSDQF